MNNQTKLNRQRHRWKLALQTIFDRVLADYHARMDAHLRSLAQQRQASIQREKLQQLQLNKQQIVNLLQIGLD